ncbi:MAG TPA: hypothetical protein VN765_01210, partial [Candidatus Acidoferrum sp.]|nr:hypothetical protein [Candidatus Acidoferrum sp.]
MILDSEVFIREIREIRGKKSSRDCAILTDCSAKIPERQGRNQKELNHRFPEELSSDPGEKGLGSQK